MTILIFTLVLFACCGFAFRCGAAPERIVAATLLTAASATFVADKLFPAVPGSLRWGVFLVDATMLAMLIAIALHANRFWPILVAAMQVNTVFAHVAISFAPGASAWAYVASIMTSGFLIPPVLAYGTLAHRRRRSQGRADRSWSQFSNG